MPHDSAESSAPNEVVRPRDLTLWPYASTRRSPLWIGLAIALVFVALSVGLQEFMVFLGSEPLSFFSAEVRIGSLIINGLLLGYIPTANALLHRGVERDLRELRPVLRRSEDEFQELLAETTAVPSGTLWLATGIGLGVGAAMASLDPQIRQAYPGASGLDPRFLWLLLHNAVVVALGLRLFVTETHVSRAYARIGEELVNVDLFDLTPLAPFARKGQRSVVLWAVFSAIFSWFWVLGSAGRANIVIAFLVVIMMTGAFLQPAVGVRRRIRAAKRAELERINDALRLERERLLKARAEAHEPRPRMADLVAYRSLVQSAHEWPFDVSSLARFLLFGALGVGSWLGGALVERLLDVLL
jgi:hypothetical protein